MAHDATDRDGRWRAFLDHVIESPGHLAPEVRSAIRRDEGVPADLRDLVGTVRRHAYRVTDAQVDRARESGYTEDQLFEAIVVAASGEGERRLAIVRALVEEQT